MEVLAGRSIEALTLPGPRTGGSGHEPLHRAKGFGSSRGRVVVPRETAGGSYPWLFVQLAGRGTGVGGRTVDMRGMLGRGGWADQVPGGR